MMDASTLISSASAPVGTAPPTMSTQTMIRTLCQVLRRMSQLLRRGCGNPRRGVHRTLCKIDILFSGKGGGAHHDSSRKCRVGASPEICVYNRLRFRVDKDDSR